MRVIFVQLHLDEGDDVVQVLLQWSARLVRLGHVIGAHRFRQRPNATVFQEHEQGLRIVLRLLES